MCQECGSNSIPMTQIAGCVVCIIFSNFYASAVFVISMVCINGFSLNFLSAVHTATKVYWLGFGVKRSKTKMSAWPNMLKIPFLVCFHGISGVCWLLFSELLSLMHLGTKMNCLDLEVKRSKVMVQAWPYVLKLTNNYMAQLTTTTMMMVMMMTKSYFMPLVLSWWHNS